MYTIGFSTLNSMSLILHLVYVIIQKHCKITPYHYLPYALYSIIPLHILLLLSGLQLTTRMYKDKTAKGRHINVKRAA